ncbi:MAG: metallophosphoesterase [Oligoflexales bacterium]
MLTKKIKILATISFLIVTAIVSWFFAAPRNWDATTQVKFSPQAATLHFLVLGDTGTGGTSQYTVAEAAEKYCQQNPLTAILMLGDNFYQAGVQSTKDPLWQKAVWTPYGTECLKGVPIIAVLGNHDYKGNVEAQIQMSKEKKRWIMPNRFYEAEFASLLKVIATDTNVIDFCFSDRLCLLDFLYETVKDNKAFDWVIAIGHHPLGPTASEKYTENLTPRDYLSDTFLKPFLCKNTDAYLAGHAHHLEHYTLANCRSEQFVSGGGGANIYASKSSPSTLYNSSQHGFLILEVSKLEMAFSFHDQTGAQLYVRKVVKH